MDMATAIGLSAGIAIVIGFALGWIKGYSDGRIEEQNQWAAFHAKVQKKLERLVISDSASRRAGAND